MDHCEDGTHVGNEEISQNDILDISKLDDVKESTLLNSIVEAVMRGDMNQVVSLALSHRNIDLKDKSMFDEALSATPRNRNMCDQRKDVGIDNQQDGECASSIIGNENTELTNLNKDSTVDVLVPISDESSDLQCSYYIDSNSMIESSNHITYCQSAFKNHILELDNNSEDQSNGNFSNYQSVSSIQNVDHMNSSQQSVQVQLPGIGNFLVQIPSNLKPGEPITVPINLPLTPVSQTSGGNPISININTGQLISNQLLSLYNQSSCINNMNTGRKMRAIAPKPSKPPYRQPLIAPKTSSPSSSNFGLDGSNSVSSTPLPAPVGPGRRKGAKGKKVGRKRGPQSKSRKDSSYASSNHSMDSQDASVFNEPSCTIKQNCSNFINSRNSYPGNYYVNNDTSDYLNRSQVPQSYNELSSNNLIDNSDSGEKDLLSLAWEISNAELGNSDDYVGPYQLYDNNHLSSDGFDSSEMLDQFLQTIQKDDISDLSRCSTNQINLDHRVSYTASFTTLPPCSTVLPSITTSNYFNNSSKNQSSLEMPQCIEIAEVVNLNTEDLLSELEKEENALLDKFVSQYSSVTPDSLKCDTQIFNHLNSSSEMDMVGCISDRIKISIQHSEKDMDPNIRESNELSEIAKQIERDCEELNLDNSSESKRFLSHNAYDYQNQANVSENSNENVSDNGQEAYSLSEHGNLYLNITTPADLVCSTSTDSLKSTLVDCQNHFFVPVNMDDQNQGESSFFIGDGALQSKTLEDFGLFDFCIGPVVNQDSDVLGTEDKKYIEPPILEDISDATPIPSDEESEDEDVDECAFRLSIFNHAPLYSNKVYHTPVVDMENILCNFPTNNLLTIKDALTLERQDKLTDKWYINNAEVNLVDGFSYQAVKNEEEDVNEIVHTTDDYKVSNLNINPEKDDTKDPNINIESSRHKRKKHTNQNLYYNKDRQRRLRKPPTKLAIYQSIKSINREFLIDTGQERQTYKNVAINEHDNPSYDHLNLKETTMINQCTRSKVSISKSYDAFYETLERRNLHKTSKIGTENNHLDHKTKSGANTSESILICEDIEVINLLDYSNMLDNHLDDNVDDDLEAFVVSNKKTPNNSITDIDNTVTGLSHNKKSKKQNQVSKFSRKYNLRMSNYRVEHSRTFVRPYIRRNISDHTNWVMINNKSRAMKPSLKVKRQDEITEIASPPEVVNNVYHACIVHIENYFEIVTSDHFVVKQSIISIESRSYRLCRACVELVHGVTSIASNIFQTFNNDNLEETRNNYIADIENTVHDIFDNSKSNKLNQMSKLSRKYHLRNVNYRVEHIKTFVKQYIKRNRSNQKKRILINRKSRAIKQNLKVKSQNKRKEFESSHNVTDNVYYACMLNIENCFDILTTDVLIVKQSSISIVSRPYILCKSCVEVVHGVTSIESNIFQTYNNANVEETANNFNVDIEISHNRISNEQNKMSKVSRKYHFRKCNDIVERNKTFTRQYIKRNILNQKKLILMNSKSRVMKQNMRIRRKINIKKVESPPEVINNAYHACVLHIENSFDILTSDDLMVKQSIISIESRPYGLCKAYIELVHGVTSIASNVFQTFNNDNVEETGNNFIEDIENTVVEISRNGISNKPNQIATVSRKYHLRKNKYGVEQSKTCVIQYIKRNISNQKSRILMNSKSRVMKQNMRIRRKINIKKVEFPPEVINNAYHACVLHIENSFDILTSDDLMVKQSIISIESRPYGLCKAYVELVHGVTSIASNVFQTFNNDNVEETGNNFIEDIENAVIEISRNGISKKLNQIAKVSRKYHLRKSKYGVEQSKTCVIQYVKRNISNQKNRMLINKKSRAIMKTLKIKRQSSITRVEFMPDIINNAYYACVLYIENCFDILTSDDLIVKQSIISIESVPYGLCRAYVALVNGITSTASQVFQTFDNENAVKVNTNENICKKSFPVRKINRNFRLLSSFEKEKNVKYATLVDIEPFDYLTVYALNIQINDFYVFSYPLLSSSECTFASIKELEVKSDCQQFPVKDDELVDADRCNARLIIVVNEETLEQTLVNHCDIIDNNQSDINELKNICDVPKRYSLRNTIEDILPIHMNIIDKESMASVPTNSRRLSLRRSCKKVENRSENIILESINIDNESLFNEILLKTPVCSIEKLSEEELLANLGRDSLPLNMINSIKFSEEGNCASISNEKPSIRTASKCKVVSKLLNKSGKNKTMTKVHKNHVKLIKSGKIRKKKNCRSILKDRIRSKMSIESDLDKKINEANDQSQNMAVKVKDILEVDDVDYGNKTCTFVDENNIETLFRSYGRLSLKIKFQRPHSVTMQDKEEQLKKHKKSSKKRTRLRHFLSRIIGSNNFYSNESISSEDESDSYTRQKKRQRKNSDIDASLIHQELTSASNVNEYCEDEKPIKIKLFKAKINEFSNSKEVIFSLQKSNVVDKKPNNKLMVPKMLQVIKEQSSKPCRQAANLAKKKIFSTAKEDRRSRNATLTSIWNQQKSNPIINKSPTDLINVQNCRKRRPRGRPPKSFHTPSLSDKQSSSTGTLKLKIRLSKDFTNGNDDNMSSTEDISSRTSTNDSSLLNSAVAGINGPSDAISLESNHFINGITEQLEDNMDYLEVKDSKVYFDPHQVDIEKIKNSYYSSRKNSTVHFDSESQPHLYDESIKDFCKKTKDVLPINQDFSHYIDNESRTPYKNNLSIDFPKNCYNSLSMTNREPQDLSQSNQSYSYDNQITSPEKNPADLWQSSKSNPLESISPCRNVNLPWSLEHPLFLNVDVVRDSYAAPNNKESKDSTLQNSPFILCDTEIQSIDSKSNQNSPSKRDSGRECLKSSNNSFESHNQLSPNYSRGPLGPIPPPQLNSHPWSNEVDHSPSLNHTASAWMTYAQQQAAASPYMDPQMKAYYNLALSQSMLNNPYCGTYGNPTANPENLYSSLHSQYLNHSKDSNGKNHIANSAIKNNSDPMGTFMEAAQMSSWEHFYSAAAIAGYHNSSQGSMDDYNGFF